ncbi:MAG: hypothetical protein HYR56_22820 [Acidobacteria bacterium]|nr:hypothetical protein [Acidobacteriota bacterium]MBI3424377.1 hypothetical protein [Acidobacteriota bacterium]
MTIEQIALICHEANRALCVATGDDSQPEWKDAPEWQRESTFNGVKFHLANPHASASHTHEEWLREKEMTGWKYGPVKNPASKEHPCIVPFEELPEDQQAKDYLFQAIVRGLGRFVKR